MLSEKEEELFAKNREIRITYSALFSGIAKRIEHSRHDAPDIICVNLQEIVNLGNIF